MVFFQRLAKQRLGQQGTEGRLDRLGRGGHFEPAECRHLGERAARFDDVQDVLFPPAPVLNTRTIPLPTTKTPGQSSFSRKIICPLRNFASRAIAASRWKLLAGTAVNNGQSVRMSMTLVIARNLSQG